MSVFHPGEKVPASGIYRALHYKHRESDGHVTLLSGQFFPHCHRCDDLIEYVLVHGAPSAGEDADLRGRS